MLLRFLDVPLRFVLGCIKVEFRNARRGFHRYIW
jgi:hypothetical protein